MAPTTLVSIRSSAPTGARPPMEANASATNTTAQEAALTPQMVEPATAVSTCALCAPATWRTPQPRTLVEVEARQHRPCRGQARRTPPTSLLRPPAVKIPRQTRQFWRSLKWTTWAQLWQWCSPCSPMTVCHVTHLSIIVHLKILAAVCRQRLSCLSSAWTLTVPQQLAVCHLLPLTLLHLRLLLRPHLLHFRGHRHPVRGHQVHVRLHHRPARPRHQGPQRLGASSTITSC